MSDVYIEAKVNGQEQQVAGDAGMTEQEMKEAVVAAFNEQVKIPLNALDPGLEDAVNKDFPRITIDDVEILGTKPGP